MLQAIESFWLAKQIRRAQVLCCTWALGQEEQFFTHERFLTAEEIAHYKPFVESLLSTYPAGGWFNCITVKDDDRVVRLTFSGEDQKLEVMGTCELLKKFALKPGDIIKRYVSATQSYRVEKVAA